MKVSDHPYRRPGTHVIQIIFRVLMGITLIIAGTAHLTFARTEFQAQVPNWVPMEKDLVVVLSGVVEIALGAALIFPGKLRIAIGWIVAVFFLAVFPGNIYQYMNRVDGFGLDTDTARFIRLFFQPLLIFLVLWCTGALGALKNRRNSKI